MALIIVFPRGGMYEFVINLRRNIKELVDAAAFEFQFESPMHI